jgi:hypothetical protein
MSSESSTYRLLEWFTSSMISYSRKRLSWCSGTPKPKHARTACRLLRSAKSCFNTFSKYSLIFIYLWMLLICLRGQNICLQLLTAPHLKSEQLLGTQHGFRVLDDGFRVLDDDFRMFDNDFRMFDDGFRVLDVASGYSMMDFGYSMMTSGRSITTSGRLTTTLMTSESSTTASGCLTILGTRWQLLGPRQWLSGTRW